LTRRALFVFAVALVACGDGTTGTVQDTADTTVADTGPDVAPSTSPLVLDPLAIAFEPLILNDSGVADLDLENAGSEPILVLDAAFDEDDGIFSVNRRSLEIPAGEHATLKVSFFALSEGGHADVLHVVTNAVNGPSFDVPVSGRVDPAECQDADNDLHGLGCQAGGDCNDHDPTIFVGAPEQCNAKDDDCDGLYDEDFVGLGAPCDVGIGDCVATGVNVCAVDGKSITCDAQAGSGGGERCNGLDDDCDGLTDEDFPSKGALCSVGLGACKVVDKYVCNAAQTGLVCPVTALPAHPEVCHDLIDNDCDGITDEGNIEVCADATDNDCDGQTDESGSRWGESFFARDAPNGSVAVYPSAGDGTFQEPVTLDFPTENNFSVFAVGDFDGDRWLDLVVRETVTEGRARCTVNSECPDGHVCADGVCRKKCTKDGDCTEFQLEQCVDTRSVNVANDTYCLPPSTTYLAVSACVGSAAIKLTPLFTLEPGDKVGPVVDVDGNGHLDFVGLHHFSKGKKGFVWLNDGAGHFTQLTPAFDYGPLYGTSFLGHWQWGLTPTSKDIDGDGRVDILGQSQDSTGSQPTDFWFLRNLGGGNFATMLPLGPTIPNPSNLTTVDDFDGDGDQDIVGGLDEDGQPGAAWMLLNRGTAGSTTSWVQAYEIIDLAPSWNAAEGNDRPGLGNGTSYDIDGDHHPDLLTAWVPEECGQFIYGCTAVTNPGDICFGGNCRKLAFIRNITTSPCAPGTSCVDGACVAGCTASCAGRFCGSDGCGGSCGACAEGQLCVAGQCTVDCVPQCDDKQCGDNGCGGTCGDCPEGFACTYGVCADDCIPNCAGKRCGDDGCGGTCAVFAAPQVIAFDKNPNTTVVGPVNVPPTMPQIAVDPANPSTNVDLACTIVAESYDLDPVRYSFSWFRDGVFQKALGDTPHVSSTLTSSGQTWTCRVRANDGAERSPIAESAVTIN
jgi:hypothetical protein